MQADDAGARISWEALGLGEFIAVAGKGQALFRGGVRVPKANVAAEPAVLRVTYGERAAAGAPGLDVSLLYRGLFPCQSDHSLAAACEALGMALHRRATAATVGELFLRLVKEARAVDREVLQLLAYLSGGAMQDLLLGLAAMPLSTEDLPEEEPDVSPRTALSQPAWTTVDSVLGEGGWISCVLPSYEVRHGQLDMAAAVAETLADGGALCVEAGPGTGKTFAYLVPCLAHLRDAPGARVVVGTRTKQLQEQVYHKDLPFLLDLLGWSATPALLKGRENYLCLRRWETAVREMSEGLERERMSSLVPLARWVFDTETGDIEENHAFLAQEDAHELWARLCDSPATCTGSFCPHVDECFSIRARRKARKADLVVVNHSLLLSDAAAGGVVLGKFSELIVDEAHALEGTARLAFTSTLSERSVGRVAEQLGPDHGGRRHGWFDRLPLSPEDSQLVAAGEAASRVRSLVGRVLRGAAAVVGDERRGPLPELSGVANDLSALLAGLRQWEVLVEEAIARLCDEPELAREGEGGLAAIGELVRICELFSTRPEPNTVHWYEWEFGKLVLHVTPLDVAPILERLIYDRIDSIVLTSATLSLNGDFTYLADGLGLRRAFSSVRSAVAESPFQYENLMRILLPSDIPSVAVDGSEYADALASLLVQLHRALGRNGLVLFTSYDLLFEVRKRIHDVIPTLAQGVDGSRASLLNRFRSERQGTVLLGTDTFWEGIDLPGEELEYVVVTRLPFAVPTDPVFAALSLEITRRGKDAFLDLALPQAVLRLRQGVGRLIRTRSDRGVVVLTDDRVRTRSYGRCFADALPVPVDVLPSAEDVVVEAARWFGARAQN